VLPQDLSFTQATRSLVAIAPDASSLVYVANNQLHRRSVRELDAIPIRGTEGSPSAPFFSPDGQGVGYWDYAAGELRRIAIAGGTPVALAPVTALYGAKWEADGTIVYGKEDGIWRVMVNGGAPERIVQTAKGELAYGPRMLPDGRRVLFSLVREASMTGQSTAWDTAQVIAQSLATGERRQIVRGGDARVVPTGHLIYALNTSLFAVPFDVETLQVKGSAVAVVEGVQRGVAGSGGRGGTANYDISDGGALAYVPAFFLAADVPRRLLSVDRGGASEQLIDEQRNYWRPRISPDGTRVAVEVSTPGQEVQIWIVDLERRTSSPLTADAAAAYPVWSPNSESVIFRWSYEGTAGIYRQAADGSGGPRLLLEWPSILRPADAFRDGVVAFSIGSPRDDIRTVPLDGGEVSEFLSTPAREHMASFSPDGKWLAYTSNESGQDEVYVRRYPRAAGAGILVSIGGGVGPIWAPDGSALYYRGASGDLMAVPTTLSPAFRHGRPQPLFRYAGVYRMSGTAAAYDIHPDGQRFIMVSEVAGSDATQARQQVNIVLNWTEELKRLVPAR
jgi:serine/threonine-protein kinase